MKATVYCLEDHKMEIREAVSVSFPDAEVKFAAYEDLTEGGELLAVDHELVHLLKKDETAGYPSVYVYFKKTPVCCIPGGSAGRRKRDICKERGLGQCKGHQRSVVRY